MSIKRYTCPQHLQFFREKIAAYKARQKERMQLFLPYSDAAVARDMGVDRAHLCSLLKGRLRLSWHYLFLARRAKIISAGDIASLNPPAHIKKKMVVRRNPA